MEVLLIGSVTVEAELIRRQPGGAWPAVPTVLRKYENLYLDSIGFNADPRSIYRDTSLAF